MTQFVTSRIITAVEYMKNPPKVTPNCVVLGCKNIADYCIEMRRAKVLQYRCAEHVNSMLEAEEKANPSISLTSIGEKTKRNHDEHGRKDR